MKTIRIPDPIVGADYRVIGADIPYTRLIDSIYDGTVYYTYSSTYRGSWPVKDWHLNNTLHKLPDWISKGEQFTTSPDLNDLEKLEQGRPWVEVLDDIAAGKVTKLLGYSVYADTVVTWFAGDPMAPPATLYPTRKEAEASINKVGYKVDGDKVTEVKYLGDRPANVFDTQKEAESYTQGTGYLCKEPQSIPVNWYYNAHDARFTVSDGVHAMTTLTKADILTKNQAIDQAVKYLESLREPVELVVGKTYAAKWPFGCKRTIKSIEGDQVFYKPSNSANTLDLPRTQFIEELA